MEGAIAVVCILAGALFLTSLGRLWPLAPIDLVADRSQIEIGARSFLEGRGFVLEGYRSSSRLMVDTRTLDYVDQVFGRARTNELIREGFPLVHYRAYFKKRGEPVSYTVSWHPEVGVIGWSRWVEEDEPGPSLELEQARELARDAIERALNLDPADFEERAVSSTDQDSRRDYSFRFETTHDFPPELRERIRIAVAGDRVVAATRSVQVPASARRDARRAEAPGRALETAGIVMLTLAIVGAFFVFLIRLRAGQVRLARAMIWPAVVFVCLLGTYALETPNLFRFWEPLWPKWVSDFQYLSGRGLEGLALGLLLLIVVAGGDALDRESGAGRGASLWNLARLRIDRSVALASGRGFLVGLLCGGVMTLSILVLQSIAGATTSLQPRGFFFYTLNTASPALTSLLFFFGVALAEELGYRFFAGSWLLALTRRWWIAIVVPAVIYGLIHTRFGFLPPAEPWWGRALVLTLVGCVWGWAFLRYDALTVVLSHFTADLFIFNWPRLASGQTSVVIVSTLTIAVPLLPALIGWALHARTVRAQPTD